MKASQNRDEQIRKLREDNIETQKRLQVQLQEKDAQLDNLLEKLERQNERKEELKHQLQEKDAELNDIKESYRCLKPISSSTHIEILWTIFIHDRKRN